MVLTSQPMTHVALGNVDGLRAWAAAGGDVNERTIDGCTLASVAAVFCRVEALRVLAELGADLEAADGDGWTPLINACVYQPAFAAPGDDRLALVAAILERVERVDAGSADGLSALMHAARQGHGDVCRLLVRRGASVLRTDSSGQDAEGLARRNVARGDAAQEVLADFLRDVRAAGGTWLLYATAFRRDLLVLRALVSRGRARPPPELERLFSRRVPDVLFQRVLAYWRTSRD